MSTAKIIQLPKSTVEMEISIPWSDVSSSYDKVVEESVKNSEISGFRKGKAPKDLVEKQLDKTKVYNEVVKDIIPKEYAKHIKEHNLIPVTSPKVTVVKAKEGEDWIVKTAIALKPDIHLKNYKDKIRAMKGAKSKIWVPGQDNKKEADKKPALDDIIKVLLETVEIDFSDILITEEANRLLADLVDQTQKLGLTVEQYLIAKGKTTDQLKAEYAVQARANLKLQFALMEIAETEKITVDQKDIDSVLAKIENEKEKERLRQDSYYLAHLIRQQKTLDFLANL